MPKTENTLSDALRATEHDTNAFEPVYQAYVDKIYSYCLYRVSTIPDAEDLTSQVFARAMDRAHTFRGDNVGAWLFRIAYHITVDFYRAKRTTNLSDTQLAVLPDPSLSPLETVIQNEQMQQLNTLLMQLDEEKRNLLLLRITGNLSSTEVGEVVGKSAGAVRVEIHRIIQKLKQHAILSTLGD